MSVSRSSHTMLSLWGFRTWQKTSQGEKKCRFLFTIIRNRCYEIADDTLKTHQNVKFQFRESQEQNTDKHNPRMWRAASEHYSRKRSVNGRACTIETDPQSRLFLLDLDQRFRKCGYGAQSRSFAFYLGRSKARVVNSGWISARNVNKTVQSDVRLSCSIWLNYFGAAARLYCRFEAFEPDKMISMWESFRISEESD